MVNTTDLRDKILEVIKNSSKPIRAVDIKNNDNVNYHPIHRVASDFIPLTIASKSIGSLRSSYGVIFRLGFAY